jgi:hypothetical protein
MKEVGINTAPEVVAVSATPRGVESLAKQLGISEENANSLVESAREVLTPAERSAMEEQVDTSEFGLGALPPRSDRDDGQ